MGIEFTLKDGTKDCYDPIDLGKDFSETETHYILSIVYEYEILKDDVINIRYYEQCSSCGYELYDDGCHNYGCHKNLNNG